MLIYPKPFVIQVLLAESEHARTRGTPRAPFARREEPIASLPPDADIDQDEMFHDYDEDSADDWEMGSFNDDFEMGMGDDFDGW